MNFKRLFIGLFLIAMVVILKAESYQVASPDKMILVSINNNNGLSYSITFKGREIIRESRLGFEFKNEAPMIKGFSVLEKRERTINEIWKPVVKSKHASIQNNCNELQLTLREKDGLMRKMDFFFRVFNDGAAFRCKLYRSEKVGRRQISKELTTFNIPGNPKAWVVEYGNYNTSNEAEFIEHSLNYVSEKTIAGIPFLMDYGDNCWIAITEANINDYAAFYIGTNGTENILTTKLSPLPGEDESGVKVRFDEGFTPWRVVMIGDNPGKLIESEIIQNLNEPCAIADASWVKPGKSAWDHWWSGEVKMEMPVIKQYIDFASKMGWPYMLVDWQWYGKFDTPEADITKWAPQINMSEIISYAKSKNVRILVWLYCSDVNRNSIYKRAFPLYKQWGLAGVKIDFMDRDDQDMVNWYHEIIKCAAENKLMVDFHGAYRPDGIIRTYPNMITREGVMGNEYYKFSDKMSPEHNVKLAFTRMLAGQMDYTPGAFLNVTKAAYKNQLPAIVWNTRAAELSKFVIYESPLTVVCDHPDHILNQPGSEFLEIVPTTWDDIKYLAGYPGDFVAIAKRSGKEWFTGIMNNSKEKEVTVKFDFLSPGIHEIEIWADANDANENPKNIAVSKKEIKSGEYLKVKLANNGGWVAHIK
jgi:alpha-glucosidase